VVASKADKKRHEPSKGGQEKTRILPPTNCGGKQGGQEKTRILPPKNCCGKQGGKEKTALNYLKNFFLF
jgi:hypothetical protein